MRKRLVVLLAAGALGVGATAPVAFGQDTETTTEEDGTDYGWIGLLGLAGLAGLLGRKREHHDVRHTERDDTARR